MALSCTADTDELFMVLSHHKNLNVILIVQNLFTKNPFYREISLNSTYHVLFKNPRDQRSIGILAQQFSPSNTKAI